MNRIYNSKNFFARNLTVILAFAIPVVAMIVIYAAKGIFPFGTQMYLRSDMYHQYATFLKEFQSILKNGDSLLYTWNIGLGSDLAGTYAYYLATPVYWFMAFLPSNYIPEIMSSFIILKAGLMSATFTIYVQSHTGSKSFYAPAFGIFYAMSSYMAAYSWNLMWLDCLLLLPLITLGLERLIKEKKVLLYTITLAIAIMSNYYIAIMICIFLVLYFIYYVICEAEHKGGMDFLKTLGRFAVYSVLAGIMAMITVIPAFINLSYTASGSFSFPTKLRFYFNILEMFSHGVMNVEPTVLSGYIPNIYCTIALFMLIPLFMICKKIKVKVKLGKVVLMGIFLFSFALNIPTYIWHGFHYPNSLSSRQSFIYIFLVLAMAYEVIMYIETFHYREIAGCFIAAVIAIYALQQLYSSETYTLLLVSVSVIFLALYFVWMMLKKRGRLPAVFMIVSLFVVVVGEASLNTAYTGYPTNTRSAYMNDNAAITELLDGIEDDGFYRVEKVKRRTKNDGAWLNYMSASEFSSTTLSAISDFYEEFGMQSSTNSFSYYGHTPLTTAILGVKYEISNSEIDDSLMTLVGESDGEYLYQNKYSLSLAFMVDEDVVNTDVLADHPFNVQNSFAECAAGVKNLFKVQNSVSGEEAEFSASTSGRGFIYITTKLESAEVVITRNGTTIMDEEYTDLENSQIVDIGDVQTGDTITVSSTDEEVSRIKVYPAVMTYEKLDEVMSVLGKNTLNITSFSDTDIVGTITADQDGVMFTSIPYYEGWDVYVDGVKTEYSSFNKAFIIVNLTAGEHTIEFKYHSPGLGAALLMTLLGIGIFVLLRVYIYRKNTPAKRKKKPLPEIPEGSDESGAKVFVNEERSQLSCKISDVSERVAEISQELAEISEKVLEIK